MSPYQAIEAATRNPAEYFAEIMKAPRDFGTVEAGMRADLLLLDANPLQSVANLSKRAGVMVRGRWLPESELRKMLETLPHLTEKEIHNETHYRKRLHGCSGFDTVHGHDVSES